MLFETRPHFFVHRLADSSKELRCSCKEGLAFKKPSLAPCSIFSVVIQTQGINPAFLFCPCFLCLFLLWLYYSSSKLWGQLAPPGVLSKEFLSSQAFLKCSSNSFLARLVVQSARYWSFLLSLLGYSLSFLETSRISSNSPLPASSQGRVLLDFLMVWILTVRF